MVGRKVNSKYFKDVANRNLPFSKSVAVSVFFSVIFILVFVVTLVLIENMKKGKKSILNVEKNGHLIKKMRYSSKIGSSHFVDLSEFEDSVDRSFFLKVGKAAAENAVNENKALRIPITFLLDGWVVRRMPTGELQKIIEVKTGNRRIAKGTILHVKRSTI